MRPLHIFAVLSGLLIATPALAEDANPSLPGDAMLADYFQARTAGLRDASLQVDWQAEKDERRRQLAEMLGLDPMPERTPLAAVVTGTTEAGDVVVEKLHFQSRPGLYVTANLYRPKTQSGPLPAVLYACGHAEVKKDGVSFGNKAGYHHHGLWFARNGYVCLTIDTLQLGEIPGVHHGTHRYDRWWWNARGYTPAGVEAWNGIRAIDYLQSRPEVDGDRIGMTGRSGGGAYTWFVTALDERVKAAVPVAGITDLRNHVVDGCVEGHCDCMFFVNTYRWDYPMLAALVAPRPLLVSNTDKDPIFPLDGVLRTHAYVREVYKLLGAEENLGLQITEGAHKDTQELRIHAFVWFDRFLKNEPRVIADPAEKSLEPERLKVFADLPADEINTKVDETFVPAAPKPKLPVSADEWASMRDAWVRALAAKSFRASAAEAGRLQLRHRGSKLLPGLVLATYELSVGEHDFRLPIYVAERAGLTAPAAVELRVLGEEEWADFADAFGLAEGETPPAAADAGAEPATEPEADAAAEPAGEFGKLRRRIAEADKSFAFFAPRGVGPTAWTADPKERTHIRRRFLLLGETLDEARILDVRKATQAIRAAKPFAGLPLSVHASGESAGLVLYASFFEPGLERLELTDLPASHRDGPELLNVLKTLDLPQTVALAAERRPVTLHAADPEAWAYPRDVADLLDWSPDRLKIEPLSNGD